MVNTVKGLDGLLRLIVFTMAMGASIDCGGGRMIVGVAVGVRRAYAVTSGAWSNRISFEKKPNPRRHHK